MRYAMLAMLVTAFGGKKKMLKDFMLFPEHEHVRKQSHGTMIAKLKMMGNWFKKADNGDHRTPESNPEPQ